MTTEVKVVRDIFVNILYKFIFICFSTQTMKLAANGLPPKQGLYDPDYEKDACGVGYVVNIDGSRTHKV